ncbi:MAG: replicative DNA helicase [Clostridia bacterium]|nr:replicative DNA helicase [Clostridia bacterium]
MDEPVVRVPPNSTDAERSTLGAMLRNREMLTLGFELLKQDDFYQPAHREIFEAMRTLMLSGQPCDLVTLSAELQRRGTLEGVGGDAYLVEMMAGVPSTVHARAYMQIVDEKATLRRLINASSEISNACYAQADTVEKIVNAAEKAIFDIAMRRKDAENLVHIANVLPDTYSQIQHLFNLKGGIDGVPTGFTDLDNLLTGLHGGELVVVGARPSMGKTSFGLNVLSQAAQKGKTVAMFSLEMPNEQLAMRLLCADARVDMQAVRRGTLHDDDWMRLAAALGPLGAANIYIDDTSGISPAQLRSRCRRLMMEHGLDMVLVDYLQLMSSDGRAENRQNEVSEISRDLKGVAKELNVPVVALAQLSRAGAQRSDKRPILSDLRDSGAIEQDADVIMFLHREEYYDPNTEDKNVAEVIVAKQRNGPLGTVKLAWLGQFTRFANLTAQQAAG